jgi:apolipoprotein N-acyltransferase
MSDVPVDPPVQPHPTIRAVARERVALGLAVLAGVFMWLGFAGMDIHVCAFISLAPMLVALRGRVGWHAFRLGWLAGFVGTAGGFSWIVGMLQTFSGFPLPLCILFAALLWLSTGFPFGVLAWLVSRADAKGLPRLVSVPLMLAAVEMTIPALFPWYLAASLHTSPLLIQTADIGGPLLIGAALGLTHAALAEAWVRSGPWHVRARPLVWPLAFWLLSIPYGYWRIGQVDDEARTARSLRVGVVQQNLGLMQKRTDPMLALERHLEASRELERQGVDLLVWSESAISFRIPEDVRNIRDYIPPWDLRTPVLFGALSVRGDERNPLLYNTAFMTDATGAIRGNYDKVYLLAFGEYIPLGETFPQLYEISRNSGHFTRGSRLVSLPIPGGTVAPLICYEDILPRFVRDFQRQANADLLAVILNDAWFGDTAEPWIHNALSKFRAIEQRRDLVRSANSGVSSIIDAAGRVVAQSGTFRRENVVGTVHLRHRTTPYRHLGDLLGWLGVAFCAYAVAPKRKAPAAP